MKYVYFLKAGEDHYKVGIATSVAKRISGIQTSNPIPISIVTTKLVVNAEEVERAIHVKLQQMRADGGGTEWFKLTPEQAIDVAIAINKNPEIDLSENIALNKIAQEQKWLQKIINKKLDYVINTYQKHPAVRERTHIDKQPLQKSQEPDSNDEEYITSAIKILNEEGSLSTSLLQRKLAIGYGRAARVMAKLKTAGLYSDFQEQQKLATLSDSEYKLKALKIFQDEGKASTSLLQRRLSIGYGKAARIMDTLETEGKITSLDGNHARVLTDTPVTE